MLFALGDTRRPGIWSGVGSVIVFVISAIVYSTKRKIVPQPPWPAAGVAVAARTVFSTTAAVVTGAGLIGAVTEDVVAGADMPAVADEPERGASVAPTTTVRPLGCCVIAPRKARPSSTQTVASTPWPRLTVGDVLFVTWQVRGSPPHQAKGESSG
jgi:hypothetical protein